MVEKHIILNEENIFTTIFHACPNGVGEFQWYLLDEPDESKETLLPGQTYESITLGKVWIRENAMNKWLSCHCNICGNQYDEFCCLLTDNFIDIIRQNDFDTIEFFDKHGMIRSDVSYKKSIMKGSNI